MNNIKYLKPYVSIFKKQRSKKSDIKENMQ